MEKLGVDTLKSFAGAVGQVVALGYGFFVEKTGIWPIITGFKAPAEVLISFFSAGTFAQAKQEVMDMSAEEQKDVEAALLAPMQPALQAKLAPVEHLFDKCVEVVEKCVAFGTSTYAQVLSVVAEFKALFGA